MDIYKLPGIYENDKIVDLTLDNSGSDDDIELLIPSEKKQAHRQRFPTRNSFRSGRKTFNHIARPQKPPPQRSLFRHARASKNCQSVDVVDLTIEDDSSGKNKNRSNTLKKAPRDCFDSLSIENPTSNESVSKCDILFDFLGIKTSKDCQSFNALDQTTDDASRGRKKNVSRVLDGESANKDAVDYSDSSENVNLANKGLTSKCDLLLDLLNHFGSQNVFETSRHPSDQRENYYGKSKFKKLWEVNNSAKEREIEANELSEELPDLEIVHEPSKIIKPKQLVTIKTEPEVIDVEKYTFPSSTNLSELRIQSSTIDYGSDSSDSDLPPVSKILKLNFLFTEDPTPKLEEKTVKGNTVEVRDTFEKSTVDVAQKTSLKERSKKKANRCKNTYDKICANRNNISTIEAHLNQMRRLLGTGTFVFNNASSKKVFGNQCFHIVKGNHEEYECTKKASAKRFLCQPMLDYTTMHLYPQIQFMEYLFSVFFEAICLVDMHSIHVTLIRIFKLHPELFVELPIEHYLEVVCNKSQQLCAKEEPSKSSFQFEKCASILKLIVSVMESEILSSSDKYKTVSYRLFYLNRRRSFKLRNILHWILSVLLSSHKPSKTLLAPLCKLVNLTMFVCNVPQESAKQIATDLQHYVYSHLDKSDQKIMFLEHLNYLPLIALSFLEISLDNISSIGRKSKRNVSNIPLSMKKITECYFKSLVEKGVLFDVEDVQEKLFMLSSLLQLYFVPHLYYNHDSSSVNEQLPFLTLNNEDSRILSTFHDHINVLNEYILNEFPETKDNIRIQIGFFDMKLWTQQLH